jgi:hypothetical protein
VGVIPPLCEFNSPSNDKVLPTKYQRTEESCYICEVIESESLAWPGFRISSCPYYRQVWCQFPHGTHREAGVSTGTRDFDLCEGQRGHRFSMGRPFLVTSVGPRPIRIYIRRANPKALVALPRGCSFATGCMYFREGEKEGQQESVQAHVFLLPTHGCYWLSTV